jgi:hypothetical protein
MTRQNISVGSAANDGTGDTLRQTGIKINSNFVEIYQKLGGDSNALMPGIAFDSTGIIFEGAADSHETRLVVQSPTADRVITIPNYTGEMVIDSDTQTLKNKTIVDPKLIHPDIYDSQNANYFIAFKPFSASSMTKNIELAIPSLADSDTLVTNTSTSTLTNKTLTTPIINSPTIGTLINDANGADIIKFTATASAVNELTIANAATGAGPTLSGTGTDTNVNLNISAKGTGAVRPSKLAPVHSTLTANGAVSTTSSFIIFSKSTALAATLADGTVTGELKYMINQNTGLVTVTPANFAQGTSFSISQYGACQIIWSGNDWYMIGGADSADTYITIT